MDASQFIVKWRTRDLTERAAAQSHFLDLCELLGHPKPTDADPTGDWFAFEKGAKKPDGSDGWADVWKKGFFGWEYKRKHKDLEEAYKQLCQYRESLENPPLLVVCDMDRIVVHTNFTATPSETHDIPLERLGEPRNLEILRAVFHSPEKLKPGATSESITGDAATRLAEIAQALRDRGLDPHHVARFLDRVVFCMFAEDIRLLPENLFSQIVEKSREEPKRFAKLLGQLFDAMAEGGDFGSDAIRHFNGDLFVKGPVVELTADEIEKVYHASRLDWSAVDPSIFGTLFERGMDPAKRSQIGAHYTSRQDIETLVEPVVMAPLRREWDEVRQTVHNLFNTGKKRPAGKEKKPPSGTALTKARAEAQRLVVRFHEKLTQIKVLDPACGSGNFLYVTLQKLKDLEKEIIILAADLEFPQIPPMVGPWQLYGIEISQYAHDLAQTVVWIGYLQWMRANGFAVEKEPILKPMEANFRCMDAILDLSDPANPHAPEWPKVDYIVGNPPFLGDKLMRGGLSDDYVEKLRRFYQSRLPGGADLCCYWFERARQHIQDGKCKRCGLLATQNIRGGASREALRRIKESGDIFFAVSDRDWVLDGANVHVSMVGFDDGAENSRCLDTASVASINANLSASADITEAKSLSENASLGFIGSCKGGPFDMDETEALILLQAAGNPHRMPNSDTVRPVVNSQDLLGRMPRRWIIDFGGRELHEAALYEGPHQLVAERVKPIRDNNRDKWLRENWWRPQRMRREMRQAIAPLARFVVTPTTSKHRIFSWMAAPTLPDHKLVVFARADDGFFGILHSRVHEVWARALGTQLRERQSGLNYNVQSSLDTFPFPEPSPEQERAIAEAAKELNQLRNNWLNPPEWTTTEVLEFPGSTDGPWARYVHNPDERGIGTVRYPRIVPADEIFAKKLKKRTLTNLYNERPTWLDNAHRRLDEAVFAAYGWNPGMSDEEILENLLALNLQRSSEPE